MIAYPVVAVPPVPDTLPLEQRAYEAAYLAWCLRVSR